MGVFAMPSLGADMEAGKLVEWLVAPGDTVRRGDVVAVVETQKGAIEIECFEAGQVASLTANVGETLPVGAPLAVILGARETPPEVPVATAPVAPARASEPPPAVAPLSPPPAVGQAASPAARIRARDLGVDLAALKGSGPGGAVLLADVERAEPAAPAPKPDPMAEMRKAIAAAMVHSKQTIPHFSVSQTIDLQPATDWLAAHNAACPPEERLLMGALFTRAAVLAAIEVPVLNGQYLADGFHPSDTVNAGVIVALRGGGLVAPAILGAETLDLKATMDAMRDLVTRARAGRLKNSEVTQGTITVSALGETGPEAMTGIIFPPQVALLAIGAPNVRPWVVDGAIVPCTTVTVTLSADHRVADGRPAARFLTAFETRIQSPETL